MNETQVKKSSPVLDFFKRLKNARETSLILIIVAICIVLSITNPYFAKWANIQTLLGSIAINGILTIGMIVVMISGGLVGAAACGLVIGLIVTKLNLSHFIVTLCFMGIARGVVYVMTAGISISLVADLKTMPALAFIGSGYIGGAVPMSFIIFLVLAIAADLYARKSSGMRKVYYTGSNEMAAKHSGIKINRVKVLACVACSVLAGIASVIYMSKYSGVSVSAGQGAEMTALSAAVIGGVSMNGGKGTVAGGLLGLLFIVLIQDAMNLFSVQAFWQDLIRYVIVLLAVILDVLQERARKKKNS